MRTRDKPDVLIWTAASHQIGLGHLRRCLALATAFRSLGAECALAIEGSSDALDIARATGFSATSVSRKDAPAAAELLVIDLRDAPAEQFTALARQGRRVAVIDDDGTREIKAHAVLNGSPGAGEIAYKVVPGTLMLLGPMYALLRPAFAVPPVRRSGEPRRALVTMGGSDPSGTSARAVRGVLDALPDATVDLVIGPLFGATPQASARVVLHHNPAEMRTLMVAADIAVASGGQTQLELAATATPTVAVGVALDQLRPLEWLTSAGVIDLAGVAEDRDLEDRVRTSVIDLARDAQRRERMASAARALVDGQGAERAARALLRGE